MTSNNPAEQEREGGRKRKRKREKEKEKERERERERESGKVTVNSFNLSVLLNDVELFS